MWSRSVCINEDLELGTMFPILESAINRQIPVIIMNPNERVDQNTGSLVVESDSNINHCLYVWEHIIMRTKF
jgi:hypothetical protein